MDRSRMTIITTATMRASIRNLLIIISPPDHCRESPDQELCKIAHRSQNRNGFNPHPTRRVAAPVLGLQRPSYLKSICDRIMVAPEALVMRDAESSLIPRIADGCTAGGLPTTVA